MSAPTPPVLTVAHAKSVLTSVIEQTALAVKATITASFASIANWVAITGNPGVTGGLSSGQGALRWVDQMASDNFTTTATIGALNNGKTWLVTTASKSFDRFYAVEILRGTGFFGGTNQVSIIRANGVLPTPSLDLLGALLGVVTSLFGFFFSLNTGSIPMPRYASVTQTVAVNDTIRIWWDKPNSTIRVYRNGTQITSLAVPQSEIPHGDQFRYFGVFQGIDNTVGVQFSQVVAADV